MNKLGKMLGILNAAMALGLLTMVILDNHNPMLKFLTSSTSKTYMIVLIVICVISGLALYLGSDRQ